MEWNQVILDFPSWPPKKVDRRGLFHPCGPPCWQWIKNILTAIWHQVFQNYTYSVSKSMWFGGKKKQTSPAQEILAPTGVRDLWCANFNFFSLRSPPTHRTISGDARLAKASKLYRTDTLHRSQTLVIVKIHWPSIGCPDWKRMTASWQPKIVFLGTFSAATGLEMYMVAS